MRRLIACLLLLFLCAGPLAAQDLAAFEKRTTVKVLPNGLTILVCERHEAPVFSFFTRVDAGSAQDPKGMSGLAHMFEHMAFKGTDKIGARNYAAEKVALERVEKAYSAYLGERLKRVGQDPQKLEALKRAWQAAIAGADKYVIENQFSEILERNGVEDMNAQTSEDETTYFYSLPENRLELWAYMESERFLHPVMREFYKERDVVFEERRMRVDSDPVGRLIEEFQASAFQVHAYHFPGIGSPSELETFSATDAVNFFHKYYVPANMVVAVVGDVTPQRVFPIVEKYFGRLPAAPRPEPLRAVEPPQRAERTVVLREASQPLYLEGYHRPDYLDPDDAVYDVISDLLSTGRTSRLYRALVRDQKIAAQAVGFTDFPGDKYPNLFAFFAVPGRGHTPEEIEKSMHAEINRLATQDVSDEELKMVKTRLRADLIRSLADNEGLAQNLATFQALYGDWRYLFRQLDKYDQVTKADIRRVAAKTFVPENRTIGITETQAESGPAAAPGAKQ
ncbi:MAG TPA: pitrilysin family protein [Terriglobales bacterium]|nr:pitrilysin family protein [Terriglobales bacterium]